MKKKLLEFFLNKDSYPHRPKSIKHIQTHISDVFIVPPYVYKIKKSVDFGFLNFSTLKKRKYFCYKEIELNRRMSEGIYVGVRKVCLIKNKIVFSEVGKTVEYAVIMKRLKDKYFLNNLLKKKTFNADILSKLVNKLVDFYKTREEKKDLSDSDQLQIIKKNIDENFELSKQFRGITISAQNYNSIKFYNELFLRKMKEILKKRFSKGFVRDCHGDLRLEHVHIEKNKLNIIDCIEFNERFRYIDYASDIAFLAMDMDYNGHFKMADRLSTGISQKMKDKSFKLVIDFYKCYRAYVRGKVMSLKYKSDEAPSAEKQEALKSSAKFFSLSLKYALFGSSPVIIVTFGFIASGKSSLAKKMADLLNSSIYSSDIIRKELTKTKLTERNYQGFNKGIYTEKITDKTYREMMRRCKDEIKSNRIAILDASFSRKKYRKMAEELAGKSGSKIIFIETSATEKEIRKRLSARETSDDVISDARLNIFQKFKDNYEKPRELTGNYIKVRTTSEPEIVLENLLKKITRKNIKLIEKDAL